MTMRLGTVAAVSLMANLATSVGAQVAPRVVPEKADRLQLDVTPEDYPPIARRQLMIGTTSISVRFGRQGEVTDCRVTVSSGYAMLDDKTCALAMARGRRSPPGDRAPSIGDGAIGWRLPGVSAADSEAERQFRETLSATARAKASAKP